MQKSRRNFMGYMSILTIAGFSGMSLQASSFSYADNASIVEHHDIHTFDPDGWL
jgi:hypothetical protein